MFDFVQMIGIEVDIHHLPTITATDMMTDMRLHVNQAGIRHPHQVSEYSFYYLLSESV